MQELKEGIQEAKNNYKFANEMKQGQFSDAVGVIPSLDKNSYGLNPTPPM